MPQDEKPRELPFEVFDSLRFKVLMLWYDVAFYAVYTFRLFRKRLYQRGLLGFFMSEERFIEWNLRRHTKTSILYFWMPEFWNLLKKRIKK